MRRYVKKKEPNVKPYMKMIFRKLYPFNRLNIRLLLGIIIDAS